MLYRFDIYLCKINMELQVYIIMGISDACWQCKENLHYTKLTWIFQKLGLHTSNSHKIFENNVCLTLFYANLLQYKLLNIEVTVQWEDERAMEILRRKTKKLAIPSGKWINMKTSRKTFWTQFLKNYQIVTPRRWQRNYEQTRFCYWNKGAVKQQWCILVWFKLTST